MSIPIRWISCKKCRIIAINHDDCGHAVLVLLTGKAVIKGVEIWSWWSDTVIPRFISIEKSLAKPNRCIKCMETIE